MRIFIINFLICLIVPFSLFAEVRTWTEKSGKTYEAEFVRELFDKLTLKMTDGREVRVAVDDLSEHDQKYLRVMVPPVMDVEFSKFTTIKSKQYDDQYDQDQDVTTILSTKVSITKGSKREFTSRLTAELFLIGQEVRQREYYILLSKTDSSFLLMEQNDYTHEFKTDPIELQVYTEIDRQRRGPEYIGYVLAISDARGNLVQVDTDIEWLKNKVDQLRTLYIKGSASVYSRYFDKDNVQKMRVPHPRDFPGRM